VEELSTFGRFLSSSERRKPPPPFHDEERKFDPHLEGEFF